MGRGGWLLFLVILALLGVVPPATASDLAERYPQVRNYFPTAERFGDFSGDPRAAPVYAGNQLIGYVFLTKDIVRIPAYSGRPINNLIGIDLAGRIVGVEIVEHEEPLLQTGVSEADLKRYVDQYLGKSALDKISVGGAREGHVTIDAISGEAAVVIIV